MLEYLSDKYVYKGYIIKPMVVCYDIRYFIFGHDMYESHYKSLADAKNAIDKHICTKYINDLITNISNELNVDKNTVIESLKDLLNGKLN